MQIKTSKRCGLCSFESEFEVMNRGVSTHYLNDLGLICFIYEKDNNSWSSCINVLGSAIMVCARDLVLGNIRSK